MTRVTKSGGAVAACVWDLAGDRAPQHAYWQAAVDIDPTRTTQAALTGTREGELPSLLADAGLTDVVPTELEAAGHDVSTRRW